MSMVRLTFLFLLSLSFSFSKDLFTLYGDVFAVALPAYALAYSYHKEDKEGMIQLVESYGVSLGATYVLKYSVNEKRPNGGKHSFPSGHTSSAFAGAWYLQRRYGNRQGVPALILASLVGASRVHAKAHYVHDVIASAILTFGVSYLIVKRADVEVYLDGRGAGLSISWGW